MSQRAVQRPPAPPWIVGPQWAQLGLRQAGWMLLPMRAFLALTFCYAGLQKLANPTYLDPANRGSVVGQMQTLRRTSPIGPLLGLSMHAPTLVGLLIAFGELAVGVGVLLGLWTRLAAIGGMLLSLTFFLTVSWNTAPYYYGSDIVFLFAWSAIAAFGAAGVLSTDGWLQDRARQLTRPGRTPAATRQAVDRRAVLLGVRAGGIVALAAITTGGLVAALGRLAGGTTGSGTRRALGPAGGSAPKPSAGAGQPTHKPAAAPAAPGTAIGRTSSVPVGQAGRFTDPATGGPAWVVHPSAGRFVAFSASCTHAGCTVAFDAGSMQFACPCHGGTFDARTGQVTGGPPPTPLPSIAVHVTGDEIRVQ